MPERKMSSHPGLSRLIEKQMRNWEIARTQQPEAFKSQNEKVCQFVTITNVVGAGGHDIAEMLKKELNWPVFDREIISTMAGDDAVRGQIYRSADERGMGWFEELFRSLMEQGYRRNDYFSRLYETILGLAQQGPAIFIGRSSDLILPRHKGFRVKVIASMERCAQNFAKHNDVSIDAARKAVARIEHERKEFVETHFHIDPNDLTRFDLIINLERFETRHAAKLIIQGMRGRGVIK